MSRISLTEELRDEYRRLFVACEIRQDKAAEVEDIIEGLRAAEPRYRAVGAALGVPWFMVGVIHYLETGRDFDSHLHNGDPLTERTQHLPDGRPPEGEPPFDWETSAIDALSLHHLDQWQDWSLPGTLFKLEGYNGWNYRLHHPEVYTPYLWNGSKHYESGKYIADGTWSDTAVAQPCGAAVLLRRMAERGLIAFAEPGQTPLLIRYAETGPLPWVAELQRFLNSLPGIFVKMDGCPGPKTSEAFFKVTGRYLLGDPRENES